MTKSAKGLVEQSYYKYGPARMNFATGNVDAIESLKMNRAKFEETGNLEYLCDVANYAMFGSCFRSRANISNIRTLMHLPGFLV